MNTPRVLHLLRFGEVKPPDVLMQAVGHVHALPLGCLPDDATREFDPQVIVVSPPFDHETRTALEKLASLNLPVLALGGTNSEGLFPHVTDAISASDLRTVLELLAAHTALRQAAAAEVNDGSESSRCRIDDLVRLLEHLVYSRLPNSRWQTEQIVDACTFIAHHLHFTVRELSDLIRAAKLRDLGKLALPDRLLTLSAGQRTAEEQADFERFPLLGARVLSEIPALRSVAQIIEYQLENFDGSGPAGLMAHQIPLSARILRVVATFVATLSDRGGHPPLECATALEAGRGALFDPLILRLLENYCQSAATQAPPTVVRWVKLTDLAEGMILAEDIWSRNGMKIIPQGTRLTPHLLQILKHFPLDPALEAVQITAES